MQVQSLGFSDAIGWLSFDQDARVSEETQKTIDSEARKIVEQAMKRTHGKATVLNVQRDREKI
jgi:ATP-dependent Zn protease